MSEKPSLISHYRPTDHQLPGFSFRFPDRSKSGEVKPRRLRGAVVPTWLLEQKLVWWCLQGSLLVTALRKQNWLSSWAFIACRLH